MSGPPGTTFVEWGTGFTPNGTATLHFKKPDGTEYPTRQVDLDSIGHFEITYPAPWDKPIGTYTWWAIDDTTGGKSNVVSYVIVADSTTYFFFNSIGDQAEDQAFALTITAKDSSYSGQVFLTSNVGEVSPNRVTLTNGTWDGWLKVYNPGQNVYLTATGGGKSGRSNPFLVAGDGKGALKGYVKGTDGSVREGAKVHLGNGTNDYSQSTNSEGFFEFNALPCGDYRLWAVWDDKKSNPMTVSVPEYPPLVKEVILTSSAQTGKTPILLVPGIMGSSTGAKDFYPRLPKDPPDWDSSKWKGSGSYGLHDSFNVGWRNLIAELVDSYGYEMDSTLFAVPYDWRMDLDDAVERYLIKAIDHAREKTGAEQVRIVAHSMGGLLVRDYIQSAKYEERGKDIEKFLMVGTPNKGAAAPYYMWFGGDPRLADEESGNGITLFYSMTCELLYESMNNNLQLFPGKRRCLDVLGAKYCVYDLDWDSAEGKIKTRDFAQKHVETIRQLLPIYDFLAKDSAVVGIDGNSFLDELWNNFDLNDVMARILADKGQKTITTIPVGEPNSMYPYGAPVGSPDKPKKSGDGTVLLTSADLPSVERKAFEEAEHAFLINEYRSEIIQFITDSAGAQASRRLAAGETEATASFSLSVNGSAAPYLADPSGKTAGIAPDSGALEKLIPDVRVDMDAGAGFISIGNPADGVYTLYLKGSQPRDYRLTLGLFSGNSTETVSLVGFNHGATSSFSFELQQDGNQTIMVNYDPLPPEGVQTSPLSVGESLLTRLNWDNQEDTAGFNIYSRGIDEPYLELIGNTQANSFDAGHLWAGTESVPTRVYAVSAVAANGTESFLSQFVKNDDRDHDGLSDAAEAAWGSDPTSVDTDGDGLSDAEEYVHGTAPGLVDTDGDGYSDFQEVQAGSDPLDPNTVPTSLDADFLGAPTTGVSPLTVQFTSNCVGVVGAYLWNFGDGGVSSEANPTHTYGAAGSYSVTLTITGPMGSDTETRSGYIQVSAGPDLSITKTDTPDPVSVGVDLTYSLQAANAGPTAATGVIVTDTLPASVTFVSAVAGQGSCTQAFRKVTCNLGDLGAGGSAGVQIVVQPKKAGTISNTATVVASESDPNPANNSATATTTVTSMPMVTIVATDPQASEAGRAKGQFTISRTGGTSKPLVVNYSVSGTAANGADYASLSGSRTIPAGASKATINVTPVNDKLYEGDETVVLTLAADAAYLVGIPNSASVTIADNDLPSVSIVATAANASEAGLKPGQFTISRAGNNSASLIVHYTVSGSATNGIDYTALSGSITIPAGSPSEVLVISPIDDLDFEGNETVTVRLASSVSYIIGSPKSATVTIADNDLPTVTVTATDAEASEMGVNKGKIAITRAGNISRPLTINYTVSGTATNGVDYTMLPGTITIAAGHSSVVITVTPKNDKIKEGSETVSLTLAAGSGYQIGVPDSASVTILDND